MFSLLSSTALRRIVAHGYQNNSHSIPRGGVPQIRRCFDEDGDLVDNEDLVTGFPEPPVNNNVGCSPGQDPNPRLPSARYSFLMI